MFIYFLNVPLNSTSWGF